mgnify:CR=1 FL=1
MGNLVTVFLLVIVGLALTPTVASSVDTATANLSGASATLIALVPMFWVIMLIGILVAYVAQWLKAG